MSAAVRRRVWLFVRTFAAAFVGLAVVAVLVGCTPGQVRVWLAWHADDPDAAVAFLATDEGQALLDDQPAPAGAAVTPGDCSSYDALFAAHGLPVATFRAIAWRESGCNHRSFVIDADDAGGGLLGLNLRAGAARWASWCGLTLANVTDADTNVRCAAAAYRRMGMAPWQ